MTNSTDNSAKWNKRAEQEKEEKNKAPALMDELIRDCHFSVATDGFFLLFSAFFLRHISYDKKEPIFFSNLFVSLMKRYLRIE